MQIFVAHPFTELPLPDYRDAFNAVAVRMNAREQADLTFKFAEGAGSIDARHILDEIINMIADCDAVICDITTLNPNVMFESGIAKASDKPLTLLLRAPTGPNAIPSDLQGFQRRQYEDRNGLERVLEDLARNLLKSSPSGRDVGAAVERLQLHVSDAADTLYGLLEASDEPMRIVELETVTGLESGIVRYLLKRLLNEKRIYSEGEGSGTRYANDDH